MDKYEALLRYYRHEMEHIVFGLSSLVETHLKNGRYWNCYDLDKQQDVCQDFQSSIAVLHSMLSTIEILLQSDDAECISSDRIMLFKDILIKLEIIYDRVIKKRRLRIVLPDFYTLGESAIIQSDKRLVECMINNILSNAVKYAHCGTNIFINCVSPWKGTQVQVLTVVDYGIGIEEDEKIYELFYRGVSSDSYTGCGIGLYVVKKIAEQLGFRVAHSSKWISDYNIGVALQFLQKNFTVYKEEADELRETILPAYRLIGKEQLGRICCCPPRRNEYRLSDNPACSPRTIITQEFNERQLLDMIKQPTYEVTMEIEMPSGILF